MNLCDFANAAVQLSGGSGVGIHEDANPRIKVYTGTLPSMCLPLMHAFYPHDSTKSHLMVVHDRTQRSAEPCRPQCEEAASGLEAERLRDSALTRVEGEERECARLGAIVKR
jgi:hypothetical protein